MHRLDIGPCQPYWPSSSVTDWQGLDSSINDELGCSSAKVSRPSSALVQRVKATHRRPMPLRTFSAALPQPQQLLHLPHGLKHRCHELAARHTEKVPHGGINHKKPKAAFQDETQGQLLKHGSANPLEDQDLTSGSAGTFRIARMLVMMHVPAKL